jgi:hypothetical protein
MGGGAAYSWSHQDTHTHTPPHATASYGSIKLTTRASWAGQERVHLFPGHVIARPTLPVNVSTPQEQLARQSQSLTAATAAFQARHGRAPPPGFEAWFAFVHERKLLVDEGYDQIHRDLAPFRKLSRAALKQQYARIATTFPHLTGFEVREGQLKKTSGGYFAEGTIHDLISPFVQHLPNGTKFLLNGLDEPRVVLNQSTLPAAIARAEGNVTLASSEPAPNHQSHQQWLGQRCNLFPTRDNWNALHGFLVRPDSISYIEELVPILSQTSLSGCFADIIFPSIYYSGNSYAMEGRKWEDKEPVLFWRGSTTGGRAVPGSWRNFHRQRFIFHTQHMNGSIVDANFTNIIQCEPAACDEQRAAFPVVPSVNGEEILKHRYVMDMDGNTFSGRFNGLLASNSLIFRMKVFEDQFDELIRPWVHYVPVALDYADLLPNLQWALEHDTEARAIAERGRQAMHQLVTKDYHQAYMFLLLLELSALMA